MKPCAVQLIIYLVLFLCPLSVMSQEKTLTVSQFNAVWIKACEKTKHLPHRETEKSEQYDGDSKPPYHTYIRVTRYIPTDRVWVIAGRKDSSTEEKYEEIRIGAKSYSREGSNDWKLKELGFSGLYYCEPEEGADATVRRGASIVSTDRSPGEIRFEFEYLYLGKKDSLDHYVRIKRMIVPLGGSESRTIFKYSYWINENGAFAKNESETRNLGTARWERQVREFDYGVKDLTIEAPIK